MHYNTSLIMTDLNTIRSAKRPHSLTHSENEYNMGENSKSLSETGE